MARQTTSFLALGRRKHSRRLKLFGDAQCHRVSSEDGNVLLHSRLLRPGRVAPTPTTSTSARTNTIYGTKFHDAAQHQGQGPRGRRLVVLPVRAGWTSRSTASCTAARRRTSARPAWSISIIREDLITDDVLEGTPTMLKWKTQADDEFALQHTARLRHLHLRQSVQVARKTRAASRPCSKRNQ